MNQKNKQMQEVFDYFTDEMPKIDRTSVSYGDIADDELHYSLPDNKATQRAMDVIFEHGAKIPDVVKLHLKLAMNSGKFYETRGIYSFPRLLDCPGVARNLPGLEQAVRLFEETPTEARICVYPTNQCLGDLLDVSFDGEQITSKKAGSPRYQARLDNAKDMREVVDLAFDIYNS